VDECMGLWVCLRLVTKLGPVENRIPYILLIASYYPGPSQLTFRCPKSSMNFPYCQERGGTTDLCSDCLQYWTTDGEVLTLKGSSHCSVIQQNIFIRRRSEFSVSSTKQKLKSTVRRTNKSEEPRCVSGSETVHNATVRLRFCKECLHLAKHFFQSINNAWASSVERRKCTCSFQTHAVRRSWLSPLPRISLFVWQKSAFYFSLLRRLRS